MNNEERIKYYMGDLYSTKIIILKKNDFKSISNIELNFNKLIKINYNEYLKFNNKKRYEMYLEKFIYFMKVTNHINNYFLFYIGDNTLKNSAIDVNYCFIKNRIENFNKKTILLKCFNESRHWSSFNTVKNFDISYEDKYDKVIWRGVCTGINRPDNVPSRTKLVKTYFTKNKNIDVGLTDLLFYKDRVDSCYLKRSMTIKEQLKYKFIISVEGNDVASGLKWQLYSNSVVIMARPRCTSWLMEDLLIPNYHYILVKDDFSDLEEKYNWAVSNPTKCKEISKNASKYMDQFMDKGNEDRIQLELIKRYFDKIKLE